MINFSNVKDFYQNRKRTTVILVVAAGAVLTFAAFRLTGRSQIQYFTAPVQEGDIVQIVNATGRIDAVTTVQVGSQVSGLISELRADFNSVVRKGDIIARIESGPIEARVLQTEADLASSRANVKSLAADMISARANVRKMRAALREAELNIQRSQELLYQGITSSQQHEAVKVAQETAIANLEAADAQIHQVEARQEQARAQVRQRQAQLSQARLDLEHTIIRTPIDGTVIARSVDLGQTVAASFSAPTLFTIAQDLTQMLVYAKTDESDVGKIRVDTDITFTVDSFPGESFTGRIKQIRMNATTIQNVVTYDTIVEFANPDGKLLPGMTAYVSIPVGSARDVVKIPNGALRYQPEISEEERNALFERYGLNQAPKAGKSRLTASADGEAGDNSENTNGGSHASGGTNGDRAGRRERSRNRSPQNRARMRQRFQGRQGQSGRPGGSRRRTGITEQVVWMLTPEKNLRPLRIKAGLTDFTYTALIEGDLKSGDELVIGQSAGSFSGNRRNNPFRRRRF